jgi:hypothetical protein
VFHACFLLNFFVDPEDGDNMILQNFGSLSTDYMVFLGQFGPEK